VQKGKKGRENHKRTKEKADKPKRRRGGTKVAFML
jgi:hypothetical protein